MYVVMYVPDIFIDYVIDWCENIHAIAILVIWNLNAYIFCIYIFSVVCAYVWINYCFNYCFCIFSIYVHFSQDTSCFLKNQIFCGTAFGKSVRIPFE